MSADYLLLPPAGSVAEAPAVPDEARRRRLGEVHCICAENNF